MPTHASSCHVVLALVTLMAPLSGQSAPKPLDTIVVAASRTPFGDAGRAIQVISRDVIVHSAARNIAELLSFQAGVDVYGRSAAQADVSLRGSTAEQTLILVDGVRVSDVQSSHYAMDLAVPLADVERIEILRGANSALFGPDAVGGVINIVTRRDATAPDVQVSGGSFGTGGGSATWGVRSGPMGVAASADYDRSDGHRAGTDHEIGQARVSANTVLGSGVLDGHVGIGIRDFGANAFYGPYNSAERTDAFTADARWTVPLAGWTLATSASTRRHADDFILIRDNPSLYENRHTSWQSTGEVVARAGTGATSWAIGADALDARLTSNNLGHRSEWRDAAFGELTIGHTAGALLDVGLRGDHSSVYGGFVSPSVAAELPVRHGVRLHASAGRGFRAPTWTERYYTDPSNQGNADLAPEHFWSGDAGVRVSHGAAPVFDLALFARNAENLIDWVKPAGAGPTVPWVATNVGNAHYRGVEATLTLPTWHGVQSTLTGSTLSFDDSQGAGLSGKYALRPVTRQVTARASTPPLHSLRATIELLAARRVNEDGYLTGNARIEWRHQRFDVTLDVTNLTNAAWLDASGVDVPGRAIYAGLAWR